MGLIKAAGGAISGTLADQWKEFFYCDSMDADVLVTKGQKKSSSRSSNTNGEENIISNGSGIAVADGQCMLIVDQGKVVELCAEPGQFTYDTSSEPSVFAGSLGQSVIDTFKTMGSRFSYGGDTGKDQRVYYINTKEIIDNKYGTANPIPFRVVDTNIGLDIDIAIRCNGQYSYKITNPMLFYANVTGNVESEFRRSEIDATLKTDVMTALQPAFAKISAAGVRYSALPGHTTEIADALNEILTDKWKNLRGIEIATFGVNSVTASKEDEDMIKELQRKAVLRDPSMAAATLTEAQSEALKTAAGNSAGAMIGFMNMNAAANAGGLNAQGLYQMADEKKANEAAAQAAAAPAQAPVAGWTCSCGQANTGKFCSSCGTAKPADGWSCKCGAVNKGRFCTECGTAKPAGEPLYKCDKCGWEPEDPKNPPKFCPECGDSFNDSDIK